MGRPSAAPCIATYRVTQKIFAVLVERYHHIVLTMHFKLVSFLHLYLLFYCRGNPYRSSMSSFVGYVTVNNLLGQQLLLNNVQISLYHNRY